MIALGLAACQSGSTGRSSNTPSAPAEMTAAPGETVASPEETPASPDATTAPGQASDPIPTLEGMPPQTNAAAIQPADRRDELTRLSTLLDFQVTGVHGSALGQATDYIINTCETYIIYVMLEPAPELALEPGSQLVIPFEAATINSGILDAEARTLALYLAPGNLTEAPAFPAPLALFPIVWEDSVRGYWQQVVRVGKLHSECRAGNSTAENAVFKIAYARQLLVAELKDGNQNLLGVVREAILQPETGKLGFYVIELASDSSLVLLPLARSNIPKEALEPGATIELVLLSENSQLLNAPRLARMDEAVSASAQNTARAYWGQ